MLVLGLIVYALFLPSRVKVERSLQIAAPAERIFVLVNGLRNWPQWSPWHDRDPQMELVYRDIDTGAGAGYSWNSRHRQVGKGSLAIVESRTNEYIANEMNFMDQGMAKAYFRFEPVTGGTLVTWSMESDMGQNPFRRLIGKMMDKWVGGDFEKGLHKLKSLAEK